MSPIIKDAPHELRLWWSWALYQGVHPIVLAALYDRPDQWEAFGPDSWSAISNTLYASDRRADTLALATESLAQTQFVFPYVIAANACDRFVTPAEVLTGKIARTTLLDHAQGLYFAGRLVFSLADGQRRGRNLTQPIDRALRFMAASFSDEDIYLYFSAMLVPVCGYDSAADDAQIEALIGRVSPRSPVPGIRSDGSIGFRDTLELLKRV